MKIGIIGYFGFGNAGDEAMREILLNEFPSSVSNNKLEIEKCDAYIIAGGDLVQSFTGLHLPHLWESVTNEPCYAVSLGVRKGWEKKKEIALKYLAKFRLIYTREQQSYDILSKYVKVNGVMPDLVLLADAAKSIKKFPVLFNFTSRDWLNPGNQYQNIIDQGGIYPVALSKEFDTKFTSEIVNYKAFISMAKSSKGVIGTRLHAVVMGAIADVPLSAIVYEYKVRKFCQRYHIPTFEYGKENGKEIVAGMKKAKINLKQEREKIKKVITEIKRDLELL